MINLNNVAETLPKLCVWSFCGNPNSLCPKKRDVYFLKVDKDYTSQTCPNCNTLTGKKDLKERVRALF